MKLKKVLNLIVHKNKKNIFAIPHPNCFKDDYDVINYGSDNVLCVINYFLQNKYNKKLKIFIVNYKSKNIKKYKDYIRNKNNKNIKCIFINDYSRTKSIIIKIIRKIRFFCNLSSSKTILTSTPYSKIGYKTKKQNLICLNYSTPFKTTDKECKNGEYNFIDYFLNTSMFFLQIECNDLKIDANKVKMPFGFPRNDTLIYSNKSHYIQKWINQKINFVPRKIIVYAPTYRDYDIDYKDDIFGYDSKLKINSFLAENKILIIVKPHPLQNISNKVYSDYIIPFEKNDIFSLYDLLYISDALITDYSSIMHDYMVTKKPILLNCFDYLKYEKTRGFIVEEINQLMPTVKITDVEQLICSFNKLINGSYDFEKYEKLQKRIQENYPPYSKRISDFILSKIFKI